MSRVDLGFLEKTDSWLLKSNYFPSKVGGKPSWLNLKDLPQELFCKKCSKPLIFLCQVYAPVEDKDTCFHRTIYIFICRTETCCVQNDNSNLLVLRNQLRRDNDFYSSEPPVEDPSTIFYSSNMRICELCGISASKHCSKCKTTLYCSREHQIADWKRGHKHVCKSQDKINTNQNEILFEEWELVIEIENNEMKRGPESLEEDEKRKLKEYSDFIVEKGRGALADISESDLESYAAVDEDRAFTQFRKKIAKNPDQVLRYNRGGMPLWIASYPKPNEIPNCEICNSPRQFEFQILPQMLYCLHENIIDWGTLVIYTCKNNCDYGAAYKREYVFKQDVSGNGSTVKCNS